MALNKAALQMEGTLLTHSVSRGGWALNVRGNPISQLKQREEECIFDLTFQSIPATGARAEELVLRPTSPTQCDLDVCGGKGKCTEPTGNRINH